MPLRVQIAIGLSPDDRVVLLVCFAIFYYLQKYEVRCTKNQ